MNRKELVKDILDVIHFLEEHLNIIKGILEI
jgi:hypothetical protein